VTPPEFGATAWGRAWVRTIERTDRPPNPLLPKARSLARNQAVTLSVTPGRVDADVVDRGAAHRVRIDVPRWPEPTRAEAARLVADAGHRGLATGDLPDAIEAQLRGRGIATAATPEADTSGCDCRTRRRPCVHVLAAVYALAQLVDERPALAVELRSVEVAAPSSEWIPVTHLHATAFYGAPVTSAHPLRPGHRPAASTADTASAP
jgi:uncharacterized Zn finger protein